MRTGIRILVATSIVALSGAVLPSLALPPCTQANAAMFCAQDCNLLGHGGCLSSGLDFTDGCYFVYTCTDLASFRWHCSCGGGCFLAGTQITLADGSTKPIERIEAGDVILAWDEKTGKLEPDKVRQVHDPVQWDYYLVVNGRIRLTP